MLKKERHAIILQQLNIHNRVMSTDLLTRLNVSEDTIRRDLQELEEEGLLIKVHGGALSKNFHFTLSPSTIYAPKAKREIALKACSLIKNGMVVLLTGGTTIRELVKVLPSDLKATFITPSIPIALELMNYQSLEVIFIGNKLNKDAQMAVGAEVGKTLNTLKTDICFLGTNAISPADGITDSSWEIIEVKRAMVNATEKLVSMVIAEKLNTVQSMQVCTPAEIDVLITELDPNDAALNDYKSAGIEVL